MNFWALSYVAKELGPPSDGHWATWLGGHSGDSGPLCSTLLTGTAREVQRGQGQGPLMPPGAGEWTPLGLWPELRGSCQLSRPPAWPSRAQEAKWEQPERGAGSGSAPGPDLPASPSAHLPATPTVQRQQARSHLWASAHAVPPGQSALPHSPWYAPPTPTSQVGPHWLLPHHLRPVLPKGAPEEHTDKQAAGCPEPCQMASPPGSLHPPCPHLPGNSWSII